MAEEAPAVQTISEEAPVAQPMAEEAPAVQPTPELEQITEEAEPTASAADALGVPDSNQNDKTGDFRFRNQLFQFLRSLYSSSTMH